MSFVKNIIKSGAIPIHFITCKDPRNRDCYYFIIASHEKMKMLQQVKTGAFDVRDYGEIIASGFGRTPSEPVRQMLLDKYGFDCESLLDT